MTIPYTPVVWSPQDIFGAAQATEMSQTLAEVSQFVAQGQSVNVINEGVRYMHAGQSISLPVGNRLLNQHSGIVLKWSRYTDGNVDTGNSNYCFVPKHHAKSTTGSGVVFNLSSNRYNSAASKYLYISNTTITGHDLNLSSGTTSGITWDNSRWVLTAVYGV